MLTYVEIKGAPLTKEEHDGNIHDLDDRVVVLEEAAASPAFTFEVIGNLFYVYVDGVSAPQGPFDLPNKNWNFRTWTPETAFAKYDVFTIDYIVYETIFAHTTEATFDPGANNGLGQDYYRIILDLGIAGTIGNAAPQLTSSDEITAGLSYSNKYTECEASDTLIIVPEFADAAHASNAEMHFCGSGGLITVVGAGAVVIQPPGGFLAQTDVAGASFTLKKTVDENRWKIFGLLARAEEESTAT